MVATQRQEQAQDEATQAQTLADAELYVSQTQADAEAYQITTTAQADAKRIELMTGAQQMAVRSILEELEGKGELANKYLDYLTAQELKENSKWIIGGDGAPTINVE